MSSAEKSLRELLRAEIFEALKPFAGKKFTDDMKKKMARAAIAAVRKAVRKIDRACDRDTGLIQ